MRRNLKAIFALTVSAVLPVALTAPASALTVSEAAALDQVFDCDNIINEGGMQIGLWNGTGQVLLVHCDGSYIGELDNTGNASTEDGTIDDQGTLLIDDPSEMVSFTGEANVTLLEVPGDGEFGGIFAHPVYDFSDPDGELLIDESATIGENPETFTLGTEEEINTESDLPINGDEDCSLLAGEHVYTLQRFHVDTEGEYTFRVVDVDPTSSYIFEAAYTPLEDTMIAVYESEFDPNSPDAAVAGCNDDFNDLEINGFDWTIPNNEELYDRVYAETESGDAIEGHFPYFATTLQPGDYTMLITTFWSLSADEWGAGEDNWGTWTPGAASIDYEVWGPVEGLSAVDEFNLAATGVDPSFGLWTGLALVGTGVAITAARRRAVRA